MELKNKRVTVIIPSLNPDEKLTQVIDALIEKGFENIIVVNDGSDKQHLQVFETIKSYKQCDVITHNTNLGKGRALKDAFLYVLKYYPNTKGVVTVDGDNQHGTKDIVNCANNLIEHENKVILGVRDFSGIDVPFKSRFGNNATKKIFKLVSRMEISDTQTGLRAIPMQYLETFVNVKGERFEYETNMLLELKRMNIDFCEVKIETIYINENETTHFRPIRDSYEVIKMLLGYTLNSLKVLFGFMLSSLTASIIELLLFFLITALLTDHIGKSMSILIGTVPPRIVSSIFNYLVNRKAVFKSDASLKKSVYKYYFLCAIQMLISYGLVFGISWFLKLGDGTTTLAKAIVDTTLFFISFRIQKLWVFR